MENPEIINLTEDMEVKEKKMLPFRVDRLKLLDVVGDYIPVVSTVKGFAESVRGSSVDGRKLSYRERVDKAIISAGCSLAMGLEYSGYAGSSMFVGAGMAMSLNADAFIEDMLKNGPVSLKNIADRAKEKYPDAAVMLGNFSDYIMKKGDAFRNTLNEIKENLKNKETEHEPVEGTL